MPDTGIFPQHRKTDIVTQHIGNEILIYDLIANKAFCLNKTSGLIWQKCSGKRSIERIVWELKHELGKTVNEEFVLLALEQFSRNNLLEDEPGLFETFSKTSRRTLIGKVILSSLITLPIVSSIVAPTPVQAQSCGMSPLANGCPCTSNGSCTSGCCGPTGTGCISDNSLNVGDSCRSNCNCPGNCCGFGNVCVAVGSVGPGGNCRVDCECANGDCLAGGICN